MVWDHVIFTMKISTLSIQHTSGVLFQKQASRAWTSNYIAQILWDVITCPCPWHLPLAQDSSILCLKQSVFICQFSTTSSVQLFKICNGLKTLVQSILIKPVHGITRSDVAWKYKIFRSRKCLLQTGSHFVQASMPELNINRTWTWDQLRMLYMIWLVLRKEWNYQNTSIFGNNFHTVQVVMFGCIYQNLAPFCLCIVDNKIHKKEDCNTTYTRH